MLSSYSHPFFVIWLEPKSWNKKGGICVKRKDRKKGIKKGRNKERRKSRKTKRRKKDRMALAR